MSRLLLVLPLSLMLGFFPGASIYGANKPRFSDIKANRVYIDQRAGSVNYSGNVRIKNDNVIIHADRISVKLKNGKASVMVATGSPVTIRRLASEDEKPYFVKTDMLEYQVREKIMRLSGNITFEQNKNTIRCDSLIYDNKKEIFKAIANDDNRITGIFFPEEKSSGDTKLPASE